MTGMDRRFILEKCPCRRLRPNLSRSSFRYKHILGEAAQSRYHFIEVCATPLLLASFRTLRLQVSHNRYNLQDKANQLVTSAHVFHKICTLNTCFSNGPISITVKPHSQHMKSPQSYLPNVPNVQKNLVLPSAPIRSEEESHPTSSSRRKKR